MRRLNTIEDKVMARVRRIHLIRQFMHPTLLKMYGGAVLFMTLNSMVSLANIVANIPPVTTPIQIVRFAMSAIVHTELFVQFVVLGLVVVSSLLVRDIVQNSRQKTAFVHA